MTAPDPHLAALPVLHALILPARNARPRRLADWLTVRDIRDLWRAIKAGQA